MTRSMVRSTKHARSMEEQVMTALRQGITIFIQLFPLMVVLVRTRLPSRAAQATLLCKQEMVMTLL